MPTLARMKNSLVIALLSVAACTADAACTGCATDASEADTAGLLDPTGAWDATLTWSTGNCMLTGAMPITMTVGHDPAGSLALQGTAGRMVTGTVICSEAQCQLSFTESGPGDNTSGIAWLVVMANLTANQAKDILGNGKADITFGVGGMCQQQFVASGHRRVGVLSP